MKKTAKDIAEALGLGGRERKTGPDSYQTFCPAHDDRGTPSLSVTTKNGKLLLHCHAGCKSVEVINELRHRGLWSSSRQWEAQPRAPKGTMGYTGGEHHRLGKPSKWWRYDDKSSRVAGYVVRFDTVDDAGRKHKTTLPLTWCRDPDSGEEKWWWKGFVEPKPCYRELELSHHDNQGKHVLIVEGEKAADAAQSLVTDTYIVVSWQGGSKAVRRTDWSCMKGRDVTLWPDADEPGERAMRELAEVLIAAGADAVRKVALPDDLEAGWDLADEQPEGLDVGALLYSAPRYTPVGDETVERFNQNFAMALVGGQTVILEEEMSDGAMRANFISSAAFREFYGNKTVFSGKTQVPESVHWLKHPGRRSYKSITFDPSGKCPKDKYNLWRGFSVEPDPTGSWDMLREHITRNICRGDESKAAWVIGWFAHMVQHPDKKLGTSLTVRGKMGAGKTILGVHMGALYRPHYVLVDAPRYVTGQFNSHMASCLLLHADEAFFAGNPAAAGLLRGLVTGDTLRVENKGKDSYELKNYLRLYVSSNNSWIVPAGMEERRFAVLDAGDGRLQDRDYFKEMGRQMKDGGYAAMLYDLLRFDQTSVDVASIPATEALIEQKLHSVDAITRFWYDLLERGEVVEGAGKWPENVVISDLYRDYVECCRSWGENRRAEQTTFKREIKKFWPSRTEYREVRISAKISSGRGDPLRAARPWAAVVGTLEEHRLRFQEIIGGGIEWNVEVPEENHSVDRRPKQREVPF